MAVCESLSPFTAETTASKFVETMIAVEATHQHADGEECAKLDMACLAQCVSNTSYTVKPSA